METGALQALESGFPRAADGLHPSKDGLDATARMDAHGIARMAGGAPIDGGLLSFPGDMGSHVPVPEILDEFAVIIALIDTQRSYDRIWCTGRLQLT